MHVTGRMRNGEAGATRTERDRGDDMYQWARDLFPMPRSLTGAGVRETLAYLGRLLPDLTVASVPSGTKAFDWVVPNEWTIRGAFLESEDGQRVVDYARNNLHVVGYSVPVDTWLTREELDDHLHSLPEQPDAIPYVTSYYAPCWGFCLSQRVRDAMPGGRYRAVVDSELTPGVMNIGELVLPGRESHEVLLSANICHPSLANNEVSGMVVLAALAQWLVALPDRRYTYRLLFLPETIGAIYYVSRHLAHLRESVVAGFVVTCAGDDRSYSYLPSRNGGTLADRVARHVLSHRAGTFTAYSYLDRGSDERQFCSPGIDLPVCSIMRSKYGSYPEYHTSLDNLSVISAAGLQGTYDVLRDCIEILERNACHRGTVLCEPQLGRRGLYPTLSRKGEYRRRMALLDVLAYADGSRDLIALADALGMEALECAALVSMLESAELLERVGAGPS